MHIEIVLFRKSLRMLKWKTHELQKRKNKLQKCRSKILPLIEEFGLATADIVPKKEH